MTVYEKSAIRSWSKKATLPHSRSTVVRCFEVFKANSVFNYLYKPWSDPPWPNCSGILVHGNDRNFYDALATWGILLSVEKLTSCYWLFYPARRKLHHAGRVCLLSFKPRNPAQPRLNSEKCIFWVITVDGIVVQNGTNYTRVFSTSFTHARYQVTFWFLSLIFVFSLDARSTGGYGWFCLLIFVLWFNSVMTCYVG